MFSKILALKQHFQKNHNAGLMIALGTMVGLLVIWLIFKAMQPVVRTFCTYVLEADENSLGRQNRIITIEAETVKTGTMTKRIVTVGKIRANAAVTIRSEMNGRIKELLFTEGASVTKGQPIIQFEDADAQAELKQAEAEMVLRKADFERMAKLHEQKIGSTKDYDKSRAELAITEGRLDAARSRVDKTLIKAPFEGTIGLIDVSVGAYVQAGQDLVSIVDATPIKVSFKVPEKHVHDIGVGQTIEVKIDAFKERVFRGTVEAVDAQVEAESHSIAIRGSIPNEDNLLRPGLFAHISLIIGEQGDTIQIDEAAVDREGEIEFVWVVEKGKAMRRRVLTGVRENGKIEIIAGIRPGQMVVTAGQLKLSDGVRVKISNFEEDGQSKEQKEPNPAHQTTPQGTGSDPKVAPVKSEGTPSPALPSSSVATPPKPQGTDVTTTGSNAQKDEVGKSAQPSSEAKSSKPS